MNTRTRIAAILAAPALALGLAACSTGSTGITVDPVAAVQQVDAYDLLPGEAAFVVAVENHFDEDFTADEEYIAAALGDVIVLSDSLGESRESQIETGVDSGFTEDEAAFIVDAALANITLAELEAAYGGFDTDTSDSFTA
jgi:hypothetical protein